MLGPSLVVRRFVALSAVAALYVTLQIAQAMSPDKTTPSGENQNLRLPTAPTMARVCTAVKLSRARCYAPAMSDRKVVFRAHKYDVAQFDVVGRDGASETHTVLQHPGAAVILPLLDDERVVLIRNHRWAIDQTLWELPAGTLDAGEAPATCAARELEEETGYRARDIRALLDIYPCPGVSTERMFCFVATGLSPGRQSLDQTEEIEVRPTSRAEVEAMVRAREIPDAKTFALLLLWLRGLGD